MSVELVCKDLRSKKEILFPSYIFPSLLLNLHHLYVYVHAGWQGEVRQSLDNLLRWIQDVDQALMDTHFKLLASVLVDERRAVDRVLLDLGRKRCRARDDCVVAERRVHDLLDRVVENFVLVCSDADA